MMLRSLMAAKKGSPLFAFTISTNQTNANLRSLAVAAGWNTTDAVVATLAAGVVCQGSNYGGTGMTVDGAFPGTPPGLILNATAKIYGGGGNRGAKGSPSVPNGQPGTAGGTALNAVVAVTVTNNGTLAGGGGGGGGGGAADDGLGYYSGGDGQLGAYDGVGASGSTGAEPGGYGGPGGTGGANGSAGNAGVAGIGGVANGTGGTGGAAGKSVNGNSNISWLNPGTRTGPIA